jgi:acetyl-CoA carboxylase carboxyltransferase component
MDVEGLAGWVTMVANRPYDVRRDCNQNRIPPVFLHDVNGFMVGTQSEQGGSIRAGVGGPPVSRRPGWP